MNLNKFEKIQNILFGVIFTAISLIALYGAVFQQARHHYATSLVCGAMACLFLEEFKQSIKTKQ